MLSVSQDFINAITDDYRVIKGRILVVYEGPETTSTFTVEANDYDTLFDVNQTADAITETDYRIAVLDGSWQLGTDRLYSPWIQAGWWTQSVCDENGVFAIPPILTVHMINRTITYLQVIGDTAKGEYPVDFTIKLYDFDGNVIHEENVVDNMLVVWKKDIVINGIYTAELIIHKWSRPHTRAKIVEFISPIHELYEDEDIISFSVTEERELNNATLPIGNISMNEMQATLYNDGRFNLDNTSSLLYNRLKPNCLVRVWIGVETINGTEWVPLGVFWTVDWKVNEKDLTVRFTARDKLQKLADSRITLGILHNTNLYEIARMVFEDAGLTEHDYHIDDTFSDINIEWAFFPGTTHLNALRTIAGAGLGVIYTDRQGIIQMKRIDMEDTEEPVIYLTADNYFEKNTPLLYGQTYTRIQVRTQPYLPGDMQEVYRSLEPIHIPAGDTHSTTIFFNSDAVVDTNITLEGATNTVIDEVKWYSWGAYVKLRNDGTSDEDVYIVVNGRPLIIQGAELITSEDEQAITDYGLIVYRLRRNTFIQNRTIAKQIADTLLESYKNPKRAIIITWVGNPALELGDKINIDGIDSYIVKQVISYDGGLTMRTETRR